jgi:membrane protein DedA with SNARE-associated domain
MNSPNEIITLLTTYKYIILIPLSIIEGPIVAVIVGFLSTMGIFNLFISYVILVVGDGVGDGLLYALGRWGSGLVHRYGHKLGLTADRLKQTREYFETHHHKAVTTSKLVHGIGFTGLIVAGSMKIPYLRFAKTCIIISIIQSAVMLILGFFFGHAYLQIAKYLNYFAAIISLTTLVVIFFIVFNKINNKPKSYE